MLNRTSRQSELTNRTRLLPFLIFTLAGLPAEAMEEKRDHPDKSSYNLFNPTPSHLMRELSADRPDKTESTSTVDAGHVQVEMDFANVTYDRSDSERGKVRFSSVEVAPMTIKLGVLNNLDVQLAFASYVWEKTEDLDAHTSERKSGFSGITPRMKLNLMGNDGGFFAMALLPFIKFPLRQDQLDNGSIEGGLAIPCGLDVPGWDIGFQTAFHANQNESNEGRHVEFDNSITIGHSLFGNLSIAAEFFSSVSTESDAGWIGTFDTWLTYQVNENLRFDGGVYIGLTSEADDWHPWIGMTCRF